MSSVEREYQIKVGDKTFNVKVREIGGNKFKVKVNDKEIEVMLITKTPTPQVAVEAPKVPEVKPETPTVPEVKPPEVKVEERKPPSVTIAEEMNVVKAPVPGKVLKVFVKPGDKVTSKTVILTFESMKMELELYPPRDGVIKEIRVKPGDSFNAGDILATLE